MYKYIGAPIPVIFAATISKRKRAGMTESSNAMNNHRDINLCSGSNNRKWADLPPELLTIIGNNLQSQIEVFRYRAVCSSWRSCISIPNRLTKKLNVRNFMYAFTICRLESEQGTSACLVKVVEKGEGQLEVLNPLIIPNSDLTVGKSKSKTLNLLKCRLIELAKGNHIHSPVDFYVCKVAPFVKSDGHLYSRSFTRRIYENGNVKPIKNKYEKLHIKVVKLDEILGTWVEVHSLRDRIFVVAEEVCFSVSAKDYPGNCIYFNDVAYLEQELPGDLSDAELELPGNHTHDQHIEWYSVDGERQFQESVKAAAVRKASSVRYYHKSIGYYAPRVFSLDDRTIRDVHGSLALHRLFSPPATCFTSTLSLSSP